MAKKTSTTLHASNKAPTRKGGASVISKHPGGRPPIYSDPSKMQEDIEKYFAECDEQKRPYTIMGLALALDMTRETLCQYVKDGKFSDIVKKAKSKVEMSVEERLSGANATGAIFWLKNHAGYKDKNETDVNHSGEIVHKIERVVIRPD